MRLTACALILVLSACGALQEDPKVEAEQCMSGQVTEGTKVSANKARQLLSNCQETVARWVNASMAHACHGTCDYSDPAIATERRDRRRIIEEQLMMRVSDEMRPSIPSM